MDFADALTRRPASMTQADVDRLITEGLDERAVHDLASIVAYFAFVNRIANGLGVELEHDPKA